jgi:hypothetical protein
MSWKSLVATAGLLVACLPVASAQGDYLTWAEAHGLIGPFAEPESDLDADGITNLMAYAFDLAPVNDPEAWEKLPSLAFIGDPPEPVMTFVLPPEIPRDVSYVVDLVDAGGKRVEIARKNGRGPWKGIGEVFRRKLEDGTTEISVEVPLDLEIPECDHPLRLRVEFLP